MGSARRLSRRYRQRWKRKMRALRWNRVGSSSRLDDLAGGGHEGKTLEVSEDGGVVIGWGSDNLGPTAFIWHEGIGTQGLYSLLIDAGLAPVGWTLERAIALSDGGRTILGTGVTPDGRRAPFFVRLRRD